MADASPSSPTFSHNLSALQTLGASPLQEKDQPSLDGHSHAKVHSEEPLARSTPRKSSDKDSEQPLHSRSRRGFRNGMIEGWEGVKASLFSRRGGGGDAGEQKQNLEDDPEIVLASSHVSDGGLARQAKLPPWMVRAWREHILAPPSPWKSTLCRVLLPAGLALLWWAVIWLYVGPPAGPGGELFALVAVYLGAVGGGSLVQRLGLHPLLGMMAAGFLMRYIPDVTAGETIGAWFSTNQRELAVTVILLKAGLGLDVLVLWKLRGLCLRVAVLPPLAEVAAVAAMSGALLGMPWEWGAMAGALVSGVAAAVVVPVLLNLQEQGYGTSAGIPSLVLAVAAVCDVQAIAWFAVFHDVSFGHTTLFRNLLRAPAELVFGLMFGASLGITICFLVPRGHISDDPDEEHEALLKDSQVRETLQKTWVRAVLILGAGLLSVVGGQHIGLAGAGAMATLVLGATAAKGWGRVRTARLQGVMAGIWNHVCQPLLFAIIGAKLEPSYFGGAFLGKAFVILLTSAVLRGLATVTFSWRSGLTTKERLFLGFAWLPKATIQAALGPMALTHALLRNNLEEVEWGKQILALAALSIVLTAPTGALLVSYSGPKLLKKDTIPVARAT